jgi:hypothetical protein
MTAEVEKTKSMSLPAASALRPPQASVEAARVVEGIYSFEVPTGVLAESVSLWAEKRDVSQIAMANLVSFDLAYKKNLEGIKALRVELDKVRIELAALEDSKEKSTGDPHFTAQFKGLKPVSPQVGQIWLKWQSEWDEKINPVLLRITTLENQIQKLLAGDSMPTSPSSSKKATTASEGARPVTPNYDWRKNPFVVSHSGKHVLILHSSLTGLGKGDSIFWGLEVEAKITENGDGSKTASCEKIITPLNEAIRLDLSGASLGAVTENVVDILVSRGVWTGARAIGTKYSKWQKFATCAFMPKL